jgi:hypothetical protein
MGGHMRAAMRFEKRGQAVGVVTVFRTCGPFDGTPTYYRHAVGRLIDEAMPIEEPVVAGFGRAQHGLSDSTRFAVPLRA